MHTLHVSSLRAGPGATRPIAATGVGWNSQPHPLQNRLPYGLSTPHVWQVVNMLPHHPIWRPQLVQNLASEGTSTPQFGHRRSNSGWPSEGNEVRAEPNGGIGVGGRGWPNTGNEGGGPYGTICGVLVDPTDLAISTRPRMIPITPAIAMGIPGSGQVVCT